MNDALFFLTFIQKYRSINSRKEKKQRKSTRSPCRSNYFEGPKLSKKDKLG